MDKKTISEVAELMAQNGIIFLGYGGPLSYGQLSLSAADIPDYIEDRPAFHRKVYGLSVEEYDWICRMNEQHWSVQCTGRTKKGTQCSIWVPLPRGIKESDIVHGEMDRCNRHKHPRLAL